MMMDRATTGPEVALISESVANANARIRFFRVAFGAATADQRMGRPEITSILADTTKGGRLTVDWLLPGDQARREVKLAFLAVQCLESAMPWGGRVTVDSAGGRCYCRCLRGTSARRGAPDKLVLCEVIHLRERDSSVRDARRGDGSKC